MVLLNTQRVLHTLYRENTPEPVRPTTPIQFDIFNQVFIESSPPDETNLCITNQLLSAAIESRTMLSTPVRQYIRKLNSVTEQLRARSIVHRRDINNLRSIIKKRAIYKKK